MHGAILMAKMTFAGTLSTPMAAPDMSFYSCMSIAWHLLSANILIETIREKGMTQSLPFLKKNENISSCLWAKQWFEFLLPAVHWAMHALLEHHMPSRHELTTGPVLQAQGDLHLPRHRLLSSKADCLPCRLRQQCSAHLHAATPDGSSCQGLTAAAAAATALPLCLKS